MGLVDEGNRVQRDGHALTHDSCFYVLTTG